MAIEIIDILSQKNNGEFALVDSNDIKGGYYQVNDIEERNSIPSIRRKEGMLCYVKNDTIYQLNGGIDNSNWIAFSGGTSGFDGNYENLTNKPTIPQNTSDLINDSGFITIDDLDVVEGHYHENKAILDMITQEKITKWESTSDFDGNYENLTNKPTIPTKVSELVNDSGFISLNGMDVYTREEIDELLSNFENCDFSLDWGVITSVNQQKLEVSQLKGTNEQLSTYRGINGQIVVNVDEHNIHVMDGSTLGGHALATEQFVLDNVPKGEMGDTYSKAEIDSMLGNIPESIGKIDQLLAKIIGCTHDEEVELIDAINGEVI